MATKLTASQRKANALRKAIGKLAERVDDFAEGERQGGDAVTGCITAGAAGLLFDAEAILRDWIINDLDYPVEN